MKDYPHDAINNKNKKTDDEALNRAFRSMIDYKNDDTASESKETEENSMENTFKSIKKLFDDKPKTGRIKLSRSCHVCGEKLQYFVKYDACACLECNTWLEQKCYNQNCPYCSIRPDKPVND